MSLKGMYAYAQKVAQGKFHGTIEERHGKLEFKGTVATEAEKNEIWNAIKTIPTWQNDINADIRVTGPSQPAATAPPAAEARPAAGRGRAREDLHGQGGRHAQSDCERASGQCRRVYEDL